MPKTRQEILTATLLRPEKSWYMRELANFLEVPPSSIQRELAGLIEAGILEKTVAGNRVYFKVHQECPIIPELRGILIKTVGLVDVLKTFLKPVAKKILVAFVYGSFASGNENVESDIDLFIIGNIGWSDMAMAVKTLEERIGRMINSVVMSPEEAQRKLKEKNHFIDRVRQGKKLFLIGEKHALDKAFNS